MTTNMTNVRNNKYRSLGRIAVANAWFDPVPGKGAPRYRFHMDVSFREERLGGEESDPVRFRVALLRCEVAVVLPSGETSIVIDPRSIASDRPGTTVSHSYERTNERATKASVDAKIGPSGVSANAKGSASANVSSKNRVTTQGETGLLLGQRSQTEDGSLSWIITRADGSGILDHVVWDAKTEPRFDIVDKRDVSVREREKSNQLHPTLRVEIHCRSEDLQIKDIELTDPNERRLITSWSGDKKRRKAAEAYIKRELLQEGLRVGNIEDPYGRLIVGDLVVSLVDDAQEI